MTIAWRMGALALRQAPGNALAQPTPDTQTLRREIDALRADYESRLQALESRLKAAEAAVAAPEPAPAQAADAAPAPQAARAASAGFQPAIGLILSGQYQRTRRDPADWRLRGFPLPPDAEVGPGSRGFSLNETELNLSASIDPWFRGAATIALSPENEASVEEAYVQTTALGRGLGVRAGRFLSGIGYLNGPHRHAWDFADAPLAYQALLGGQSAEDGLQLTWIAPTARFFEVKAELGRGAGFPGNGAAGNGAGRTALSAHLGDDVGTSHSWRAGVSVLQARARDQELGLPDATGTLAATAFSGRTRVWIADAVWKWAPDGNATRRNFKLQGEYLRSTRSGTLVADPAGAASADGYRSAQSGWYLQGVYQFMPRWRAGLRTERLDPGTPSLGVNTALLAPETGTTRKHTLLLEHNPSEFSRIRLQLAQDRTRPGASDLQWLLQYQMSLGAHPVHGY